MHITNQSVALNNADCRELCFADRHLMKLQLLQNKVLDNRHITNKSVAWNNADCQELCFAGAEVSLGVYLPQIPRQERHMSVWTK
jgi:hypothetical protein